MDINKRSYISSTFLAVGLLSASGAAHAIPYSAPGDPYKIRVFEADTREKVCVTRRNYCDLPAGFYYVKLIDERGKQVGFIDTFELTDGSSGGGSGAGSGGGSDGGSSITAAQLQDLMDETFECAPNQILKRVDGLGTMWGCADDESSIGKCPEEWAAIIRARKARGEAEVRYEPDNDDYGPFASISDVGSAYYNYLSVSGPNDGSVFSAGVLELTYQQQPPINDRTELVTVQLPLTYPQGMDCMQIMIE